MKRLLIKLGMRIGDPFDWEPTPWPRLCLWARRRLTRKANATCGACGYRGIRTRRYRWCPACHEDFGGELIRDRKPVDSGSPKKVVEP